MVYTVQKGANIVPSWRKGWPVGSTYQAQAPHYKLAPGCAAALSASLVLSSVSSALSSGMLSVPRSIASACYMLRRLIRWRMVSFSSETSARRSTSATATAVTSSSANRGAAEHRLTLLGQS